MADKDSNLVRLTGLWEKETEKGGYFLVGSISPSSRFLVFPNSKKRKDSEPDYVAYIAPQEKRKKDKPVQTAMELFGQAGVGDGL